MIIRPDKTKQIIDSIYVIRTFISNFYIYNTGKTLIAFDAGINPSLSDMGMKKLGLDSSRVGHVFLTHSDYDHAGGLPLFKNAAVYLSKKEEPMVTRQKARLLFKYNKKLYGYKVLDDRQTINIDNNDIQIIITQGHTPGSSCYLINGNILVSGDTLRTSPNGKITPFLFFQNMDHNSDKLSIEMLHKEGIIERSKMILTGHTGILNKEKLPF